MKFQQLSPYKIISLSFLIVIISGTILLLLPISRAKSITIIDVLFTSTSATCVTGLTVIDIGKDLTIFGQIVILICIQIGGLGLMTFSSLIAVLIGRGLSFKDKTIVVEAFLPFPVKGVHSLIKEIFLYTFLIEFVGAFLLFIRFSEKFHFWESVKLSIFHSISAFCNAGFSLFSNNLMSFRGDLLINITVIALIFLGGIGFFSLRILAEFLIQRTKRERFKIPLHFRIVVLNSILLILAGSILIAILEWDNTLKLYSLKEKIIASVFQAVTPRTAGFNTIDISRLTSATTFLIMILMFIGASPGSTGGGIKTSTFFIIISFLRSRLKGGKSIVFASRNISFEVAYKAFVIFFISLSVVIVSSFLLFIFQKPAKFDSVLFEVFSAFGTVGLSKGLTPFLKTISKVIIIMTMFIGRVGPVTLVYALSEAKEREGISFPEERVMVG
ncbi:MAG: TrkH family potassium uptake protein [Candidatus Aminicenantia bacterium]